MSPPDLTQFLRDALPVAEGVLRAALTDPHASKADRELARRALANLTLRRLRAFKAALASLRKDPSRV